MPNRLLYGTVAIAIGACALAGCSSNNGSSSATTAATPTATGAMGGAMSSAKETASSAVSSAKETASSAVSSALNTAEQTVQDGINKAVAAAPISFGDGSSDLSTVDTITLKAVSAVLKTNDSKIEVEAYATGSNPVEAKSLANQRANNVAAELEGNGIDKSRISTTGTANPGGDVNANQAKITVQAS